jgi:hypothetical protein
MIRNIQFISKKYDWGWSVWIEVNGSKTLLADKLKNEEEVQQLIDSLPLAMGAKVEMDAIPEQGILLKPTAKRKHKPNKELRALYLSKLDKNTPKMSQSELIDDSMGDEI